MPVDRMATRWNGWGLSSAHNPMEGRDAAWPWVADALGVKELPQTHPKPLAEIALPPSRLTGLAAAQLADVLRSDQIAPEPLERASHARGKSYHDLLHLRAGKLEACPDAVVYPENADDALQLLQWAQDHDAAIVPFGGGSSVVGGVTAQGRDLVIAADMTRMNAVVSTDPVSRTAVAQGGIYGIDLETKLQAKGLTLGHYPQSFEFSTLGGWIAARGAGQQSNRYGKAEKWLVGAELATPSGLWRTEQFPASAAGPNFNHLVAGSEGTLGLITEARFRVHTVPNVKQYRTYLMPSFEAGADAIRTIVQDEVPVATMRLSDPDETHFYQAFARAGLKAGWKDALQASALSLMGVGPRPCALIIGFEGERDSVHFGLMQASIRLRRFGGTAVGAGPALRWYAQRFHGPYLRDPLMDRGVGVDTLETATQWSNISTLYQAVRRALMRACSEHAGIPGARGLVLAHISHSYPDGASLYFTFIFPRDLTREIAQWQAIKHAASEAIAGAGGTISHHHGVGEDHLPWLVKEKGALGLAVLEAVKNRLDPKGIMNPGKLLASPNSRPPTAV